MTKLEFHLLEFCVFAVRKENTSDSEILFTRESLENLAFSQPALQPSLQPSLHRPYTVPTVPTKNQGIHTPKRFKRNHMVFTRFPVEKSSDSENFFKANRKLRKPYVVVMVVGTVFWNSRMKTMVSAHVSGS